MKDAGRGWRSFIAGAAATALILFVPAVASAAQWYQAAGIGGPVVDVVVQTGTGKVLAAKQGTSAGIYKSGDNGVTWTLAHSFTQPNRLADDAGIIFAATSQGLYKSTDLSTWTAVGGGLPAGIAVSYVGRVPLGVDMYATVASGTSRGLYKSTDGGATWTLVKAKVGTQAITKGWQCGVSGNATVFAGGKLSPGGPACTLLKSTDSGSTWSCTTFPLSVADVEIDCYTGTNFKNVYVTSDENNVIYRSTDLGSTFSTDKVGISDCCASNTSLIGTEIGTLSFGLYTRNYGPIGTTWTQFDTTGLTDLKINHWLRFDGTVSGYVAATPSGVFYYGDNPPPCQNPPCP